MAQVQLNAKLSDSEVESLVTFLGSLTGTIPESFERAPVLPADGFAPNPSASPSRPQ
ncbi:hypothetical protein [Singulisphaera acidiphila]|uniref:hypothetical protein n=1 Tax=Singulisphaera acidiphila TaxID=466153 RepID=UPI00031C33AE|nr:hypothetical protein [Singulisphaera acidiphila]